MTYLLDTNAISDLMRAVQRIESWMAELDPADRIVTCTIVRGEISWPARRSLGLDERSRGAATALALRATLVSRDAISLPSTTYGLSSFWK